MGDDGDRWIVIPNWDKFQHYGDRDPPWFKTYVSILHDDAYLSLSGHQRGTLHGLWALYAAAHRQVRDSTATVSRQLSMRVTRATLDALNHAGLIEFSASKPLATNRQDKTREEEIKRQTVVVPINQSETEGNDTRSDSLAERLLTEISDATGRTRLVLYELSERLPDAAFATALESLQQRRQRTDQKPLTSEARYVVATLKTMEHEGQYAR